MFFDTHAHMTSSRFDKDRDRVIRNFKKDKVSLIVNPGAFIDDSIEAVELAQKYDNVYATVGVHPSNAKYMDDMSIDILSALARKPKVVAIGEIGLDYHHMHSPKGIQIQRFIEQINLAKKHKLPIVIHDRKANEETYEILLSEKAFELGVLMHCYSGNVGLAKRYVKKGALLSIPGPVTYRSAHILKDVVKEIPLDHLVIETDSPSLQPAQIGKRRNEPKHVIHIAQEIADIKGISLEEVAEKTLINGKKFYRIK